MGIFQGTADQIASKDFVKNEVTAFKNGAAKQMVEQRVPKLPLNEPGAPYDSIVAVYESAEVDENGLPLNKYYKHIPSDVANGALAPNFIVRRNSNGNVRTNTPVANDECANKKYVDDAVAGAGGGGSADLSNYYTKNEIDAKIGDIETALDNIIAIQEKIIGGDSE